MSRSGPCAGVKPTGSSLAPSSSGTWPRSHSAPGPQAMATATTAPAAGPATGTTRRVPGPSGVRHVRQMTPPGLTWKAGSPRPRLCTPSTAWMSRGNGGRQVRVSGGAVIDPATARCSGIRGEPDRPRPKLGPRPDPDAVAKLVGCPDDRTVADESVLQDRVRPDADTVAEQTTLDVRARRDRDPVEQHARVDPGTCADRA